MTLLTLVSLIIGIVGLIVAVLVPLGAVYIFRLSISKATAELREQFVTLLQSEIVVLNGKIERLREDNARLNVIFNIMKRALSSRGIFISIEGDMLSIRDDHGFAQHVIVGGGDQQGDDLLASPISPPSSSSSSK